MTAKVRLPNCLVLSIIIDANCSVGFSADSFIMLAARSGKAIRFHENATRPMGRNCCKHRRGT